MTEHKRLTTKEKYPHGAEGVSKDKLTGKYCRGIFEATACVEKLAEYETAEEDGRLVWLPCKIGDVLYLPIDFQNRIYTGKCVGFEYSRMRRKWVVKVFTSEEGNSYEAFEHFGKTFFLTREEAEKALEEMKNALEKHITARIKSEEMVD